MSNKRSVFLKPERQHYSDYGFDPQLGFFQVLEEAMEERNKMGLRSPDSFEFKLQKPMISGEEQQHTPNKKKKKKKKKNAWWRRVFPLLWKKATSSGNNNNKRATCSSPPSYLRFAVSGPLSIYTESSGPPSKPQPVRSCSGPLDTRPRRNPIY
ncbi:hypothetical protein J5N97_008886 [Dioscorea zingiberensis]|uniref:Uncharacterized protein n=1 Tax=Dioscorea zingiberensis TaxID=325984 RepID=A0A9D5CVT4_9LILI|nr:hypothetical protein J5N97_008886 [Dioscorea zingiberensis]